MSEQQISKSKQKRLDQKNARAQQKKKKAISVMWGILIPVIIVGLIVGIALLYKSSQLDYGKYLNADGTIQSGAADIDYQAMSFSKAELLPSDETVENDIESVLESHKYISEDASKVVSETDTLSIAYDSTLDGVSYNSVSADDAMELTIGYATLGSEVDSALIGKKAGDIVSAAQTYEDDYSDEMLAGKTVEYEITILGIYEVPVLDDAFVQTNLSDEASTAEEYRQNIIDGYYNDNLTSAIEDYVRENVSANAVPEKYVENLVKIYYQQNEEQYNYYNEMYYSYLGYHMYDSVYGMFGYETQEEYEAFVEEQALEDAKYSLALQSIYYAENMTNTQAEIDEYFTSQGYEDSAYSDMLESYGKKYTAHLALEGRVVEHLCDIVSVTE